MAEPHAAAAGLPARMKAAVYRPGAVQIQDIERPVPKDDEVLVRIHASTICAADYRLRRAPYPIGLLLGLWGRKTPTTLGMEFSGTVAAAGRAVTGFRPGDQVFGGGRKFGGHAEYVCAPENRLELKPSNMPLEEAAAIMFGGLTAVCFLRKAKIQAGQNVLVYGASGSVGVYTVQLAKHFGARVTGVCSTANLELVKSLGADEVVDYTRQDFSSAGRVYDMIFDTVGKSGFSRSLKCLKRGGAYVRIAPSGGLRWSSMLLSMVGDTFQEVWTFLTGAAKTVSGVALPAPGDLSFLKGLIETGELRTVIDRRYSLEEIAEAYRYAETGHKKGHVLILVAPPSR